MAGRADSPVSSGRWLSLCVLPALAVLIGLGVWQLERREWKHAFIARLEARLAAEPIPLPALGIGLPDLEFRRVRLEGRFLHDREQLLVGRSYQGQPGYAVFTPFALSGGRYVFVDRGWIPVTAKDAASRQEESGAGPTALEGVIRLPPEYQAAGSRGNEHYRLSLPGMATQAGLDPAAVMPVYVVATGTAKPGQLPVPRSVAIDLPDNHLQYALTWFALAGALAVIYVVALRRR